MGAKLKHCITSSSKQFNGKIKKHNLKYLLNFMSLNFVEYQQKNLQPKVIVSHKPLVEH
jgi:hypothetical protein